MEELSEYPCFQWKLSAVMVWEVCEESVGADEQRRGGGKTPHTIHMFSREYTQVIHVYWQLHVERRRINVCHFVHNITSSIEMD